MFVIKSQTSSRGSILIVRFIVFQISSLVDCKRRAHKMKMRARFSSSSLPRPSLPRPSLPRPPCVLLVLTWLYLITVVPETCSQSPEDALRHLVVREERPADTVFGDITQVAGLDQKYSATVLNSLSFIFLGQTMPHTDLFILDEQTGVIRTRRVIDRDLICPQQWMCVVRLDVAVQPAAYFAVYKIDVYIVDVNDNSPTFPSPRLRLTIPENAVPLAERYPVSIATDLDSPPNGVTQYRFSSFLLPAALETFRLEVRNSSAGVMEPRLVLLKVSHQFIYCRRRRRNYLFFKNHNTSCAQL